MLGTWAPKPEALEPGPHCITACVYYTNWGAGIAAKLYGLKSWNYVSGNLHIFHRLHKSKDDSSSNRLIVIITLITRAPTIQATTDLLHRPEQKCAYAMFQKAHTNVSACCLGPKHTRAWKRNNTDSEHNKIEAGNGLLRKVIDFIDAWSWYVQDSSYICDDVHTVYVYIDT